MSEESSMSDTSSPSLLSNLRQFRFQKKFEQLSSASPLSSSFETDINRKRIVPCIEESDTDDDPEIIPLENGTVSSDVAAKEKSLKSLLEAFPNFDEMILQDALLHNDWDVEKAKEEIRNKEIPKKRARESPPNNRPVKKVRRKDVDNVEEDKDDDDDDEDSALYDDKVFDSDDSEQDISDSEIVSGDRKKVLDFFANATVGELRSMSNCSLKKAEAIIEQRPFNSWKDLVEKFQNGKYLGTELLNAAHDVLHMRQEVQSLMKKCIKLATQMERAVLDGQSSVKKQPALLSEGLTLTGYQLVGLNWLKVMHSQQLNGILADEMGLGKTIQIIAFLAHLKETNSAGRTPHLVIVPSSTLENWKNEFERWCPSLNIVLYYGTPDERKLMRIKWVRRGMTDIDVILTTYSIVNSSPEEKKMYKVLPLGYVILDEAHMLKNMTTQRYEHLTRINAEHRILLTGTPLQNNLLELMSLLIFVMPKMFAGKKDHLKSLFSKCPKQSSEDDDKLPKFEQEQVAHARRIMKPFVLRRLKADVLKDLPKKTDETILCPLLPDQKEKYDNLITMFSANAGKENSESGMAMMMQLRKISNHPVLLRYYYSEEALQTLATILSKDPAYKKEKLEYIFQDLLFMSDFELYALAKTRNLSEFYLPSSLFFESGKIKILDELLPQLQKDSHRVIIFSQFVIMLDVLQEYLTIREFKFLRLDGSTPVPVRQELIDTYNQDPSILVFLLSTRAGGMGINLTAADTVIIHDIDFNPYNDKQAEDRCHRVGQSRNVKVMRLISEGTIEEGIYQVAQEKLSLEKEINNTEDNEVAETKNVVSLLKQTLGLDSTRTANLLTQQTS